jgi:hypothetical protein
MSGLSDLLTLRRIAGTQLGFAELQRRAGGGVAEVQESAQGDVVAVQASRQEVPRIAPLPCGEAVELADRRLALEREVQGGEALRWIPAPAVDSGAYARERVML